MHPPPHPLCTDVIMVSHSMLHQFSSVLFCLKAVKHSFVLSHYGRRVVTTSLSHLCDITWPEALPCHELVPAAQIRRDRLMETCCVLSYVPTKPVTHWSFLPSLLLHKRSHFLNVSHFFLPLHAHRHTRSHSRRWWMMCR